MTTPTKAQYNEMSGVLKGALSEYLAKFDIDDNKNYAQDLQKIIVFIDNFRINTVTHSLMVPSVLKDLVNELEASQDLISRILEITQLVKGRCTVESGDLGLWADVAANSLDNCLYQNEGSLLNKQVVSGLSSISVGELKKMFDSNQWLLVLYLIVLFNIVLVV